MIKIEGAVKSPIVPRYFIECLNILAGFIADLIFAKCFIPNTEPNEPRTRVVGYFIDSLKMSIPVE